MRSLDDAELKGVSFEKPKRKLGPMPCNDEIRHGVQSLHIT